MELNKFIDEIKEALNDPKYQIATPKIIPKLKGDKRPDKNKCRPISLFSLKDRIIISLVNKYLTRIFDKSFYGKSFAFRATQSVNGKNKVFTHHDSIEEILAYKRKYKGKRLYISECDISKFFDSVSHKIIKESFKNLSNKIEKESLIQIDPRAKRIFQNYLDCYSFVHTILPLNKKSNAAYWLKHKIPGGEFTWVKEEIEKANFYKRIGSNRIGIPQGGALSGLIANLVLNDVDHKLANMGDRRLLYTRYCDDMVILHPSPTKCAEYAKIYETSLENLKLIPHAQSQVDSKQKDHFWGEDIKSKAAYKWSKTSKNSVEWFGFVGYEISFDGDLRVRSKSLRKEKKKQKDLVDLTIKSIKNGRRRSDNTIRESVINRLNGMSVGRVNMRNHRNIANELCWVNGFQKLNNNKHSRAQLKSLDKYKAKQFSRLLKALKKSPLILDSQKTKIGKGFFTKISGLSKIDSEQIRIELVKSGILNKKFEFTQIVKAQLTQPNSTLELSGKYLQWKDEILLALVTDPENDRVPSIYGKPFSYYYNIIEKQKPD
ncbi:reverse transcriptase/maturase family protein [Dyadobacter sp. BHUBP1]|uniref:reverse transcriptase/maturase family protein n=1 Tax=Dyadobacter sp. BHUBP1 TaxID=3424178 RepID=UPI003D326083